MFEKLEKINRKPTLFEFYTRLELWNDEHLSKGMLKAHLDPNTDWASRNKKFMDKSIEWIISHFKMVNTSAVIDFGCGPGMYTSRFAETGASVAGVDFSERSIRYAKDTAKERGLNIAYFLQDYLEFSIERRFDLITMIWCDFSALSPRQRAVLLEKFRKLLADDGSILLDVDSMVRFQNTSEEKAEYEYSPKGGFFSPGPYHLFSCKHKYYQQNVLLEKQTIITEDKELELFHWAQCYSLESLQKEFNANGLQIVESYSDVAGTPLTNDSSVIAVVAKKAT